MMAQSLHEMMLAELPLGGEEVPADGATDSVGMRERIMRARSTVDAAATGERSRMSLEQAQQSVRDAQSVLVALGFSLEADDHTNTVWDNATRAALEDFQEEHGMRRTGHLDAETYEVLMAAYEQAVETQARDDEDDFYPMPGSRTSFD